MDVHVSVIMDAWSVVSLSLDAPVGMVLWLKWIGGDGIGISSIMSVARSSTASVRISVR